MIELKEILLNENKQNQLISENNSPVTPLKHSFRQKRFSENFPPITSINELFIIFYRLELN